jgi:hypothetical protein
MVALMAINIPSEYEPIDPTRLIGRAPFDDDPLDDILELGNWLYANHSPPILCSVPNTALAASHDYVFPLWASADALDYECLVYVSRSATATVTVDFYESSASSWGAWGAATSTTTIASADTSVYELFTLSGVLATTRFAKLSFTWSAGTGRVMGILIYPKKITSITAAQKSSGFHPYDAAHLTSTGAAIHTEYINRAYRNVASVYRDRRVCLACVLDDPAEVRVTWKDWAGNLTTLPGGHAKTWIGGQAGATVTVRARAVAGETAATAPVIRVREAGGVPVELICNGTDRSATLTINTDSPTLVWDVLLNDATTVNMAYIVIEWRPGD